MIFLTENGAFEGLAFKCYIIALVFWGNILTLTRSGLIQNRIIFAPCLYYHAGV